MSLVISESEVAVLAQQEAIIERGLQTFYEVGTALVTIRDQRLYRQEHTTFDDYCQSRWGMARRTAYQLIDAAGVVENVRHGAQILPSNERQARPLAALPPEQQAEAWQEAVDTAPGGKITAAHVTRIVEQRTAPPPDPKQDEAMRQVVADIAEASATVQESQAALGTIERGYLPAPRALPAPSVEDEHARAVEGLDRYTGGKISRDRALRAVENAINTIATQDATIIAQAADEDTLAQTFDASLHYLEQWIGRYRTAKANRHRIVSFVSKGA